MGGGRKGEEKERTVAAPAQQRSQVISRSEHPRARSPRCTFFLKKVVDLF